MYGYLQRLDRHMATSKPDAYGNPYENEPWIKASHALLDCSVWRNLAFGVTVPDTGPLAAEAAGSGMGAWMGVSGGDES